MGPGSPLMLVVVLLATFALTLPFGAWRVRCRRYSFDWFLSIHLPVPLVFLMRYLEGFSSWYIPLFVAGAALGHLAGGRWWPPRSRPQPPATAGEGGSP